MKIRFNDDLRKKATFNNINSRLFKITMLMDMHPWFHDKEANRKNNGRKNNLTSSLANFKCEKKFQHYENDFSLVLPCPRQNENTFIFQMRYIRSRMFNRLAKGYTSL